MFRVVSAPVKRNIVCEKTEARLPLVLNLILSAGSILGLLVKNLIDKASVKGIRSEEYLICLISTLFISEIPKSAYSSRAR